METITYLIQKNTNGKIKFIQFALNGATLTREWGLIGGVCQGTVNTYEAINVGKANEQSPEEAAEAKYKYIWNKKIKEGYVPTPSLDAISALPDFLSKLDLDNIPKSFCLSKPTAKISDAAMGTLLASGHARIFVKYNGGCHYVVIGPKGNVEIYTRRWDNHTAKYPKIVQTILDEKYPPNSLFAVELCIDPLLNLPHMTCLKNASKVAKTNNSGGTLKADLTKSHALQENPLYSIKAAVFGILYYNGAQLWNQPYEIMLKLIEKIVPLLSTQQLIFQPQNIGLNTVKAVIDAATANQKLIEGFVIWDTTKAMEVTMNGKPVKRAAYKIKIKNEKDVIAYGWENANNKPAGIIGALKICQYDAKGNMVDLGTVGGLKPKEGETDPANWSFPCVIEVGYDNRFPETGRFQFGHFNKVHEDKVPEEVEIFDLKEL